jgi:ribosomal protein S18 acetylase RimI-like enzyme
MALIIRDAIVDDAAGIAEIQVTASRASYGDIVPRGYFEGFTVASRIVVWRKLIAATSALEQIIAGEDAGGIRAYAAFGRSRDVDAAEDRGELQSPYVSPDRWRSGLGAQMLTASTHRLKSMRFKAASLWVLEANQPARDFYERFDWRSDVSIKGVEREPREIRYRTSLHGSAGTG